MGRRADYLYWRFACGRNAASNNGGRMNARDAISLAIIIVAGTGGELCVTHTMKRIGEVKSFYPHHLLRVIGRAFRIGWMWIGLALMTLSFFSLLMLLSWENVSFVVRIAHMILAGGRRPEPVAVVV